MDSSNISCPVCTLYLRPGITLKSHLTSHPKQKVIEALVRLAETEDDKVSPEHTSTAIANQSWNQANFPPNMPPGNHVFIYQQSMSTSSPQQGVLNVNPLTQQYVIPAVLNPQMMPPYIYQQQQVIMSGSCLNPMRTLPFELPPSTCTVGEISPSHSDSSSESDEAKVDEEQGDPIKDDCEVQENINDSLDMEVYEVVEPENPESPKPDDLIELNKACQTQSVEQEEAPPPKDNESFYFVSETDPVYSSVDQNNYQSSTIYTSSNMDFVNMDGMHMVINDMNDFSPQQMISHVENFEHSPSDRPGVLITIGGMVDEHREESMSTESSNVNIRTDERMPPRGELSGQESIDGASDITWNRVQYDGSSGTSYDLVARESWEASDSSDIEIPPLQSRVPPPVDFNEDNDTPTVVSFSGPPLNFKCPLCEEAFTSSRERKEHESEKHPEKTRKINSIGLDIGKKKVKKLVVKMKSDKTETNFDNVFTNKLKIETSTKPDPESSLEEHEIKPDDAVQPDLKTVCSICDCVLLNTKSLREHKAQVHNITAQTRHKCTTCEGVFPNDYKFTEHLKVHPLECKMCGRLFYRRQNMQLHMRRHLGIKPYKCEVCEKSFLTKQKLDEHRNIHTGEAPIKCTLCDETFRRHSNLVQHRNRHHLNVKKKLKDYICFCKEIFHSKKKLAWHKEIHDSKPKSCAHCNEKFIHMSSLTRHMRRAHNDRFLPKGKKSENVECPICKGVYLKSSLEVHIRNHSGQRPYSCLICNKDFTTKWNLKLHKWTHASRVSKPFKCDQCKGAFIRESDFVAHMNSHKSIRPYTCNYCGAQFIRKYNCQRHVKEHENEKMFSCKVCGKSFHRSYYLKDHMRIHSGLRPYSCHICGKTSTTKSNHNKHIQIHHAREPVSTEN